MPVADAYRPDPRFPALGPDFADVVAPATFPAPRLRWRNDRWARRVGLHSLTPTEWERAFLRFDPPPDNIPAPLAMRYHGHQFRVYNPDIGDGRGFLLAQLRDDESRLLDLATKGSGRTPHSRTGDGRMTLQSGVRETLAAAFLEAAGVPGCAILSLYETGEELVRYDEPSPARGAVMTRLQHSHVRIGTFQRHAYENSATRVDALMEHCIEVYYPSLKDEPADARVAAFLGEVVNANARLAASWMAAGYVHGVLNSDNMTVTGTSFDYGPFRVLPVYEPGFTAAYFDQGGIFAYGRQAEAVQWNLHRLAQCLTLIAATGPLETALAGFSEAYETALGEAFCRRLGVYSQGRDADTALVVALTAYMLETRAPFEGALFDWFGGEASAHRAAEGPRGRYYRGAAFDRFRTRISSYAPADSDALANPYFCGEHPVSLTLDGVRDVWRRIAQSDDWSGFEELIGRLDIMREAYA